VLLGFLLAACSAGDSGSSKEGDPQTLSDDGEDGDAYEEYVPGKADGLTFSNGPLSFSRACDPGNTTVIAAVGDVLLHGRLQEQAVRSSDRFISLWSPVRDLLEQADVTYANLEGPTASGVSAQGKSVTDPGFVFDGVVYSSYPMFNYHPLLATDLVASGVDVVSVANNHALDRRSLGVDRTLDALDGVALPYTGTRRQGDGTKPWYTFTEKHGFRIAWLACTYATNGISDPHAQVLRCFEQADTVEGIVRDLSTRADVDAVIVTPHWGVEYNATPELAQVKLGHRFLDAGATAILGSHPHVLQPWEKYVTADGRETFVIYSFGNFVSGQTHLPRRSTLLLYLGLTRFEDGNVGVNGVRYVPLHVSPVGDDIKVEAIDRAGGPADSRALTVGMFGSWNVFPVGAALVTNPQCDPAWAPPEGPHPHDGWIGGACENDAACGGTTCLPQLPGGLCSQACTSTCPDKAGRATTFCVSLDDGVSGSCLAQCVSTLECRTGYVCRESERFNEPSVRRKVCVPDN
jgi:poly-gamma-glutamate synthesis protein (capsule biosynthesis protein)